MRAAPLAASNPRIRRLRRLFRGADHRRREGCYVIEGPILVREAIEAGAPLEEIYVGASYLGTLPWMGDEVGSGQVSEGAAPRLQLVADGVLERVLDSMTPRPIAATVARETAELEQLLASAGEPWIMVLAGLSDPGNVGTLLRSAEASGASGLISCAGGADPFGPKAVRASAGSIFRLPVVELSLAEALDQLRRAGMHVFAAHQDAATTLEEVDFSGPLALVIGGEAGGIPDAALAAASQRVAIPMARGVDSLNAAMAGTILAFEVARRRRFRSPTHVHSSDPPGVGGGQAGPDCKRAHRIDGQA